MKLISAASREEWRAWLSEHHASEQEVWLSYYKKHTSRASVAYIESVKEALCFGWIDGLKRRIDDERYAHRFTPRKTGSKWSPQNVGLAQELIETGEMTEAGLAAYDQRVPYDQKLQQALAAKELPLAAETKKALKTSKKAWINFNQLSSGYRKQYVGWIQSAKRPETRAKRIKEAIGLLEENKKLGMK